MKTQLIIATLALAISGCANGQSNTAAGAAIGAVTGVAVGANNKAPITGAVAGAIVGGLVGNAIDQNQQANTPPPQVRPPEVIVKEVPTVIVETPVIIEERIWAGNDLWIYSYRGFRDARGHVRYQNHVPIHRRFIRGGHRW